MKRRGVVLGFSGGIDSATAVGLLCAEGYEVTALTLDTVGDDKMLQHARSRAEELGVSHIIKDGQREFRTSGVDYFAESYLAGRTPAPCTICNSAIKWRFLLSEANRLGVEAIATGHYFNIERHNGLHYVARAVDSRKDQSYYLWGLSQEILSRAVTPMGGVIKEEVKRAFADKRESMGLCFLGGVTYREFMEQNYPASMRRGDIVDMDGRKVGEHDGVAFYTIGQKRGLDVEMAGACIVKIDAAENRLIVGNNSQLYYNILEITDCNIVDKEEFMTSDDVRVVIRGIGRNPEGFMRRAEVAGDGFCIYLDDPAWAPAIGQPVVFYRQNRVIGGGILSQYR